MHKCCSDACVQECEIEQIQFFNKVTLTYSYRFPWDFSSLFDSSVHAQAFVVLSTLNQKQGQKTHKNTMYIWLYITKYQEVTAGFGAPYSNVIYIHKSVKDIIVDEPRLGLVLIYFFLLDLKIYKFNTKSYFQLVSLF